MVILTDNELRNLSSRELSELIKRAKGYNYRARIFAAREAVKQTEKAKPKRDPMRVGKMSPAMAKALEIADRKKRR